MKDEDGSTKPPKYQRKHPYAVISQVCGAILLLFSSIMMAFTELERMSTSSTHDMNFTDFLAPTTTMDTTNVSNAAIAPLVTHVKWPAGVVYMVAAIFLHYQNRHIPWRDHLLAVALVVGALSGLILGFDLQTIIFVPLQFGVMICLCCSTVWSCCYRRYGPMPWWATAGTYLHWETHNGETEARLGYA